MIEDLDGTHKYLLQMRQLLRRGKVYSRRRAREYRACQLQELKLVTVNTMHKRLGKSYRMLAKPIFKEAR